MPVRFCTPRPRTRNVRPLWVPAGIRSVTEPSSVGTSIVLPSASSGKVTGTVTMRSSGLSFDRPNTRCGVTCTLTYRSPAGAPPRPGSPWPASLIRCPSSTPAGTRMVSERVRVLTPSPPHSGHGSSMIRPVPRQSRHGSENANAPWLRLIRPRPEHVGHCRGAVPGRAPVPEQVWQRPGAESRIGTSAPWTACVKSIRSSVSTSAPRCPRVADARVPRPPAPPKSPPSRSPRPGPAPPVLPNRSPMSNVCPPPGNPPAPPGNPPGKPPRPAAAGEQGAGLVVLAPLLLVREHPVGLGHRLEAGLGLRVAGVGVRVQLAGELAVRLLDLVLGRAGGDAQLTVEVLLDPVALGHSASLLSLRPGQSVGRRVDDRDRLGRGLGRRPSSARSDHGHHRGPQDAVADAVAVAQHRGQHRHRRPGRRPRVSCWTASCTDGSNGSPSAPNGSEPELLHDGDELVGHRLERAR